MSRVDGEVLVVGVDPAWSGWEGVASFVDGELDRAFRKKGLTARSTDEILSSFLRPSRSRAILAIEEWTIGAGQFKTTANTITKLERAGARWEYLGERLGYEVIRANTSTWRAPFKIRGDSDSCKRQAKSIATMLFGGLYSPDVAEAILIGSWADGLRKTGRI